MASFLARAASPADYLLAVRSGPCVNSETIKVRRLPPAAGTANENAPTRVIEDDASIAGRHIERAEPHAQRSVRQAGRRQHEGLTPVRIVAGLES